MVTQRKQSAIIVLQEKEAGVRWGVRASVVTSTSPSFAMIPILGPASQRTRIMTDRIARSHEDVDPRVVFSHVAGTAEEGSAYIRFS